MCKKSPILTEENSDPIHKYSTSLSSSSSSTSSSPISYKFPPGPPPYPIIGNILEIGSNPLLSITNLSQLYGPIMALKLGTRTAIVISSPEMAKQAFLKHDLDFSGRIFPESARGLNHHKFSITWLPISSQWRTLRRACVTNMLSTLKLDSTQFLRENKVGDLINHVYEYSIKGEAIDLAEAAFTTVLNSTSNLLFSKDFACYGCDKSKEYKKLVIEIMNEAGRPNVCDLFPILSFIDPQRARARMRCYCKKLYDVFEDLLEERLSFRGLNKNHKDYNDVLESFIDLVQDGSSQLSRNDILHLFLVSII